LTCREKIESNESKWCILTLFEPYARRLLGFSLVHYFGTSCWKFISVRDLKVILQTCLETFST